MPRRLPAAVLMLALAAGAAEATGIRRLEFLGHATLPHGHPVGGTPVGGLSALAYDAERGVFYALADDVGQRAPARFYTVRLDLTGGKLDAGGVTVDGVTFLRDVDGEPFALKAVDPEGLALAGDGHLFFSSEGYVDEGVAPLIAKIDLQGNVRELLRLPERYLPRSRKGGWLRKARRRSASGVRHNQAFESLTLSPSGEWLFTANEGALHQDGPAASVETGSPVRLSRLRARDGGWAAEYLYRTEPVAETPVPADAYATAGLVELLAFDDHRLLALERSFSVGAGNTIRLFEVDLSKATNVAGLRSLERRDNVAPAGKRLLLDLAELSIELDNVEGLAFGPPLADGRRTLILVSDDNFNPRQTTQILAFAFGEEPVSVADVQGHGHRSPLESTWIFDATGVVTAIAPEDGGGEVWVTEGDEWGLRLTSSRLPGGLAPGDRVRFRGRVAEPARSGALSVTTVVGARIEILSSTGSPSGGLILGGAQRPIPSDHVDDDSLTRFEPDDDAIDFFERYEGLRVEIRDALVVGPGSRFGECVVVAGGGAGTTPRTRRGGLRLAPFDPNPERLIVSTSLLDEPCRARVGDRFDEPLTGVLHYDFGSYRLLATAPLPGVISAPVVAPIRPLADGPGLLTIATFNVENLHPDDEMIPRLAAVIRDDLGSPGVVALQEVQDDSGPEDDGTTSAALTFAALVEALATDGGPRYEVHQIDPLDRADGGRPGGNIRVGFLVDPRRVEVERRGRPGAEVAVEIRTDERGPLLFPNPGRVTPGDPAFAENRELGYRATRKPLALEIEVEGRRIFLINAHLKSKGGDDPVFGSRQPPHFRTEEQRSLQAARIRGLADELLAADPKAAVVVLGDLNDHEFRGPLTVLTAGSLVNLIERVPEPDRYTYNYRGNSQVLDHVLVSPALEAGAEILIQHVHADFPVPRPSDHDPVLARLKIDQDGSPLP